MKKDTFDYLQWIEKCAAALNASGHYGQAINYRKAGRSLARFLKDKEVKELPALGQVTQHLIMQYNLWLEESGLVRNSVSFYNRQLRAVYNRAVRKGMVRDASPFRDVYTGVSRTCKRAVSVKDIRDICSVVDEATTLARDLFEFSFVTCGMTFVDMAYLKKSDVRGDTIIYCRRKTGTEIVIPISEKAGRIIKKYEGQTKSSRYVFPILGNAKGEDAYRRYLSAFSSYNRALKAMAGKAAVSKTMTSYVSRHSWATAARNAGAPVSVISAALGHGSEKTTQIYLGSLDVSKIGTVNRKIMASMACRNGKTVL